MSSDTDWRALHELAWRTAHALATARVPTQPVDNTRGWVVHEHCAWLEEKNYARLRDDPRLCREETGYETFLLTVDGRLLYEERTELLLMNRGRRPERILRDQSTVPCGPDNIWRLDVTSDGAGARRTVEDGVEIARGGWDRRRGGPRLHAAWGAGLRQALEELPRRQYNGGSRGNYYAWTAAEAARPQPPAVAASGPSTNQILLIVGAVMLVILVTCACCVGALLLAGSK